MTGVAGRPSLMAMGELTGPRPCHDERCRQLRQRPAAPVLEVWREWRCEQVRERP